MTKLIEYLPSLYHDIKEVVVLTDAEDQEFEKLQQAIERLLDDQFVDTASEWAIKRRELQLEIRTDPTVESLEFRRKRLVNRYSTNPPFTTRYLQQQLDTLVGPGMTIVSVDVQNFVLTVTTNIENASVFREVVYTVESVKPANLVYQQNTSIINKIGLEERISRKDVTWNYALGGWRLGEKPFITLGPEVAIK